MTLLSPVVEIYVNAAWTNITAYVRVEDGVVIQRGRQDEQATLGPGICTMTLNNTDGRFSPRNPTGPYYGTIGRNTPVRVSMDSVYRFYGEISAWPPRWDVSENNGWVTVQAAGITRRLTQGPKALQGPITRFVGAASNVFAYWPLEDAQGASSVATGISNGRNMELVGTSQMRLAADSTFPTSEPLPILNSGGANGTPNTQAAGDSYTYFLMSVPVAGDTNDSIVLRLLEGTQASRWEIRYFTASSGSILLRCFDDAGASLLTSASITGLNGVPGVVVLGIDQNGANVDYTLTFYDFATGAGSGLSGSFARTEDVITAVQISSDRALTSTVVGHLLLTSTNQITAVVSAMRGYAGETAAARISRLCTEEAVTAVIVGTAAESEAMGPQTAMTLMELLAQCEASDGGYLHEPKDSLAIAYRVRTSMYATAGPDLTLAYTNLSNLEPVEDDQATRNDVTVARIGGSSARHEVTTGPLSTQAPPNGVGAYKVKADLSLETDDQCLYKAQWLATLGTLDEPRYPVIQADLRLLAGATKTAAKALDIGDYLKVTSPPKWVPPSGLQALVLGYTETILPHAWYLAVNCGQGSVWASPFVLNSTTLGRLDSETTTLNGAHNSTTTTINFTGDTWVTTAANPGEFPFAIVIGGEEMTVTAATASTFTVTRSVNGIVKSHSTGSKITLSQRNRVML